MANYQEARVKLTNTQLKNNKIYRKGITIPLAREKLPGVVSNLTSNAINKLKRKISAKVAIRTGKGFTLFILNEDMNDIIKIIKSLEDSDVLIDGISETVKHEIKKKKADFFLPC